MFLKIFSLIIVFYCLIARAEVNKVANIEQLKEYLRNTRSVAIDFSQSDLNNNNASGMLLLNKPFKFRCNYYQPFPILVVGGSNYVSIYDYDMDTVTYIKQEENIFNFLTTNDVDFEKYFTLQDVVLEDKYITFVLYHEPSDKASYITFDRLATQLKTIKIYEADNIITINFNSVKKVAKFDPKLFELKNPKMFGKPTRYNQEALEKLFILENK